MAPIRLWPQGNVDDSTVLDTVVRTFLKILMSFSGIAVVPTTRKDMNQPVGLKPAGVKTMLIVAFIYVGVSAPAVAAWGVPSTNVLGDSIGVFRYTGSFMMCCNLLLS